MKIHALTSCVRYSDYLARGIEAWVRGLERLTVVTTPNDAETLKLCERWAVPVVATEAFHRDGAPFAKASALNAARAAAFTGADFCLYLDSDIIPPADWREYVQRLAPQPGNLYGCFRTNESKQLIPDGELAGFFHLFAASDPNGAAPLDETTNASGYDSLFMRRWPIERRVWLPMQVIHQGPVGRNWCGRGDDEAMRQLREERRRLGGWQHERLNNVQ